MAVGVGQQVRTAKTELEAVTVQCGHCGECIDNLDNGSHMWTSFDFSTAQKSGKLLSCNYCGGQSRLPRNPFQAKRVRK